MQKPIIIRCQRFIRQYFFVGIIFFVVSCNSKQEHVRPISFAPKVVEAHGYLVPKDSMAEPRIILVDEKKLKKIPVGVLEVVPTNTNVHPAGIPKVVIAGVPKICTPGQGNFSLPKTVPAIDSPFIAGVPEIVMVKEAYAKDQNPQNFSFFGKLQGLKHGNILCLSKDKAGNLWLGSLGGGASKYDGKSFTHFTEKEGLSNNIVRSILEDKSGNIWFGTGSGISKYDGKKFANFAAKDGFSNSQVWSILQDKSGNLWFGVLGEGLIKYDGSHFTHFTEKEGLSNNNVNDILEDNRGNLWLGTDGGVSKYDGNCFTHLTEKEGLSNNGVMGILEDRNGNLWFGTKGGVNKYDGKTFTHFTEKEGLSNNDAWTIAQDKSGNFWFGTFGGGVNKYDGKSFTHFTEMEGLSNNVVRSILEDNSGNLWFGTNGGGMNKYDVSSDNAGGKTFTHFTENEGLSNSVVRSIVEDKSGNLWFGTMGGGVNKYDGKSFTHFTERDGMSHNTIWSILEDKRGNLWFGTGGGGANKYDGKSFTHFTDEDGLGSTDIRCILQDKSGNLWFGTGGDGVSKYDGKSFTRFTENEGLSHNIVRCILEDKSGNLWFGTSGGGVSKYNGKNFIHFSLNYNDVTSILEDKTGNLWFSTAGGGVSRYDGKSFTYFTEKEGLCNDDVNIIIESKGALWFGTRVGLSKLEMDKWPTTTNVVSDTTNLNSDGSGAFFTTFLYEDGFSGIGVNSGKTMLEAKDGTIWIGADDRLTAMRAGMETPDTTAPNIQLTGIALFNENMVWQDLEQKKDTNIVLANGVKIRNFHFDSLSKWYRMPQNLSLAYNNNYLTFHFVGITIQSPKKVKYQYKLEGLDNSWSTLTNGSEASYGNLTHGRYTFRVKAKSGGGYWSKELEYAFTIRPPWWKTWWAYSIDGLCLIASLFYAYRFQRERVLEKERRLSRERELLQAKEIEKAYHRLEQAHTNLKTTQSQLIQSEKMASLGELTVGIAHEIQNPLNFVNNFSDLNKELVEEMKAELKEGNNEDAISIANDIAENEQKINHHGKRADAIVKGMLQHSRSSSGVKEPTDINALVDEYFSLAYHGFRAKDKSFNATMKKDFGDGIGRINIVPQDIGRVILNLISNAFYAVTEKKNQTEEYEPTVSVSTKKIGDKVEVRVVDNGNGIPPDILDKIFQPFFTTKPTGQGTGLGLSLAYDIVKAHGGELKVETVEGEGAEFIIHLPVK
jgi:ligand-binding sensor domain-containing protein/signal transduction histidine kinase